MPEINIDNHHKIYYKTIPGNDKKPYLIFLHEGLGCVAMWNDFPELLCDANACPGLVYDRLGYGKSSPLIQKRNIHYLHDYALFELPRLLTALIKDRPYILIGHSDGGSISLIYGAKRPSLLKGIITEAAHVFVENETIAGIRKADDAWDKGKIRGLYKYHGDKTETIFKAWSDTWLSEQFRRWTIEDLLPDIEVPLLVLQGGDDHYGTQAQVETIVSGSGGPSTAKIIGNCAHSPHLEAQPETLMLMSEFIAQLITAGKSSKE